MFLHHLSLTDVRSIGRLELPFLRTDRSTRAWTYLLGENGCGKSSVLRAIGLVMAGRDALYELVGEPDDWIRLGSEQAKIEAVFATQEKKIRKAALRFRRGERIGDFVDANRETLELLDAAIDHSARNYFVVGYGVTRKPAADKSSFGVHIARRFRAPRARAAATLFDPDATLVSLEQWAMDLEYRRGSSGLAAVRQALNQLLPDVTFTGIDREQRRLMFQTADGKLPLSALSDGYQAMAAWCGDLLWQITETFKDHKNPLKARGLLLVDELDLHLHPVWQRRLVSFLKQTLPNFQVVATTHSPLTVHQADEGELFVLRREAGHVAVHPYEGAPNRLMLHQLLQSPIFGLDTLDSPQVEELRKELRELQRIGVEGEPSQGDRKRIREVERRLSDVPDWRKTQPYLAHTNQVLEMLASKLSNPDDDDPVRTLSERMRPARRRR